MSQKKRRRKWTPAQKLQIVLETLQSDRKLAQAGAGDVLLQQVRKDLEARVLLAAVCIQDVQAGL